MNRKKHKIIIIVASILLIGIITLGAFFLADLFNDKETGTIKKADTTITVSSVTGTKGNTVIIPIKISNNAGFMACFFNFEYDNSALEYIGYEEGDIISDYQFNDDNGTLKFVGMDDNDVLNDGVIVNLKFKILKNTTAKTAMVKLIINEDGICNYNEEFVKAKSVNGTVTIH